MTDQAHPDVRGTCPACLRSSLFLGAGGFVACSIADCPNPYAPSDALYLTDADSLRVLARQLLDRADDLDPPDPSLTEIVTDCGRVLAAAGRCILLTARHRAVLAAYRIRPYDFHRDARRWTWQTPGRELSRRWLDSLTPETRAHIDAALQRLVQRDAGQQP